MSDLPGNNRVIIFFASKAHLPNTCVIGQWLDVVLETMMALLDDNYFMSTVNRTVDRQRFLMGN